MLEQTPLEQTTNANTAILRTHALGYLAKTATGLLPILTNITLEIFDGDSLAVTGASGSGKTTLLGLLAGLDLPTAGCIWLAGQEITQLNEDQRADLRAHWVGFIFQSFQLLPGLTARENVMLACELRGQSQACGEAESLLARVQLEHRFNHYPRQLSGGEQQRVAIARAFANHPKILFADEPTGNLDTHSGNHIADLLFQMNREQGTTLILVTHEKDLAKRCCKQITLAAGEVIAQR